MDLEHDAPAERVTIPYRRVTKPADSRTPRWKQTVAKQVGFMLLNLGITAGGIVSCVATIAAGWFVLLGVWIPITLLLVHSSIRSVIELIRLLRHGDGVSVH